MAIFIEHRIKKDLSKTFRIAAGRAGVLFEYNRIYAYIRPSSINTETITTEVIKSLSVHLAYNVP